MAENINPDELANAMQAFIASLNYGREALDANNPVQIANAKATEAVKAANERLAAQAGKAGEALKDLGKTVLEGNGSLSKYNKTIESTGDIIYNVGKEFGPLGKAVGATSVAFAKLAGAVLVQTDNLLKASDQMAKMGAANEFSTDAIKKMAHGASLSTKELDKLTKPMQSVQSGFILIGNTAGEGMKKFGEMIKVSDGVRKEFLRLGMDDPERIQAQADYLNYLSKTGTVLVGQAKTGKALQEASLEYTRNLYELSAITGKSLDQAKSEQEIARATMQWRLQENKWGREQQEALKRNDKATYDRIEKEKTAANALVNKMMAVGGPAAAAGVQMQYLTGAITKHNAQLAIAGVDAQKHIDAAKRGQDTSAQLADEYTEGMQRTIDKVGQATVALSETFQKTMHMNIDSMDRQNAAITRGSMVTAERTAKEAIAANKAEKGAAAEDERQKQRAELLMSETKLKIAFDELVDAMSPLINKWTLGTFALGGIVASLIATKKTLESGKIILDAAKMISKGGMIPGGFAAGAPAAAGAAGAAGTGAAATGAAGAAATGAATMAGGALVAGAAGFAIGTYLNKEFKLSDKIVDALMSDKDKEVEAMMKSQVKATAPKKPPEELAKEKEKEKLQKEQADKESQLNSSLKMSIISMDKSTKLNTKSITELTEEVSDLVTFYTTKFAKLSDEEQVKIMGKIGSRHAAKYGASTETSTGPGASGAPAGSGSPAGPGAATAAPAGSEQALLDFVGKIEARGDYNMLVGGKANSNLTNMTIKEVLDLQTSMARSGKHESTAVGKYQIIKKTLQGLVNSRVVSLDDVFNSATQDKLAMALMKQRGLDSYKAKKISADQFADNLSMEWASLPFRTGKSYYDKVGSNRSLVSRNDFLSMLPKAQLGGFFEGPASGYPVMMHGKETVIPTPNLNELTKLLGSINKTDLPKSAATTMLFDIPKQANVGMQDLIDIQTELVETITEKLDAVISQLSQSNTTQDKLLKYSKV